MAAEKIGREDFIQLISDFLEKTGLGFEKKEDCWILEQVTPGGTDRVVVNGKLAEIQRKDQTVQFKVEVVGQGDVRAAGALEPGDEFLHIRFSVWLDGQVVRELEDCIYIQNNLNQFRYTFKEIFR